MKKSLKFILIFICLFIVSLSPVYAVGIDMNLNTNTDTDNSINIVDNNNTVTQAPTNITPRYSTSNTSEDFKLTVSDIIDIILISVGIVIILLGIAILLKIR